LTDSGGKSGEKEIARGAAASLGENEVGSVGANRKDHVAGVETESGVGVSRQVVKKHVAGSFGFLGGGGLLARDFVEGGDDRGITPPRIVKEGAGDLLHTADSSQVEERGKVRGGELSLGTVDGGSPEMRCMLGT
jgi:hypothetical protein